MRESGGMAPRILKLETRWKWLVSFTLRPLYFRRNSPRYTLLGWVGNQRRSGRLEKIKIFWPCQYSWAQGLVLDTERRLPEICSALQAAFHKAGPPSDSTEVETEWCVMHRVGYPTRLVLLHDGSLFKLSAPAYIVSLIIDRGCRKAW
jgi:hypothetical protein